MILQDLFESNMNRVLDAIEDLRTLGDTDLAIEEFTKSYGMPPVRWVRSYYPIIKPVIKQYPFLKKYLKAPDAHLFHETDLEETFVRPENAREQQAQLLARTYAELYWGNRSITERARTAREIFRALETGELDMATLKMEIRALEREHDLDETTDQERQADRNARIIAGEIEDAAAQGNDELVKQKIKQLIQIGYTLNKQGQLQRMGMYEESQLQEKQDACYHKVKSRYKVWPSAYASGALVQCRKKGAANWGNKSKK
jgi:hypothetical protein